MTEYAAGRSLFSSDNESRPYVSERPTARGAYTHIALSSDESETRNSLRGYAFFLIRARPRPLGPNELGDPCRDGPRDGKRSRNEKARARWLSSADENTNTARVIITVQLCAFAGRARVYVESYSCWS